MTPPKAFSTQNESSTPYRDGPMTLTLEGPTLDDVMRLGLAALDSRGTPISPTRGPAVELIGAALEITNPRARLSRSESRRKAVSAIGELCWYLSGTGRGDPMVFYLGDAYRAEVEEDGTVHGAYGPRLFGQNSDGQIYRVIELLRSNPGSRRAVVQVFDRNDVSAGQPRFKDVPCTCTMQFVVRNDLVHLIVNMRSNDIHLGFPHDVFAFTMLQELVARSLNVEVGRYIHIAGSLHLYERNREAAQGFLREGWQSTTDAMPPMPDGDPWSHVDQLLLAERQIREGVSIRNVELPTDPYWADLARLLAAWVARCKANNDEEADRIEGTIESQYLTEFIR